MNAPLCRLPERVGYENTFRFVTPNGQIIRLETCNMFYRDEAERARMARSRGLV